MNSSTDVLHVEENGVELFTVIETGESAVSERGLARMSGVDRQTMRRWFSGLAHPGTPDWLKPLIEMDLYLAHEIKKRGKLIKPISAKAASKFLNLVARHLKTAEAFDTIDAIGEIGLNSYIQGKTGWLPSDYQSSQGARESVDRILSKKCPYKALYKKPMCDRAFGWFGASFYWNFFYFWMTPEERAKLERVNPVVKGRRKTKIHQWIEAETKERLRDKAFELGALIIGARSRQQFLDMFQANYGEGWQMDIFD